MFSDVAVPGMWLADVWTGYTHPLNHRKTTTMLFKILGLERSHRLNTHIIPERPRQLFVTQSHVLVEKVEEAYNKLAKTLDVETYSKDEVKALALKKNQTAKDHLIRSDDTKDQGKSLPQRFSDLKDEHFPLFVNYDRVCRIIVDGTGI